MKKLFVIVFLSVSLGASAQVEPQKPDTIVLDKLFRLIGRCVKKTCRTISADTLKRKQFQEIQTSKKLKLGATFSCPLTGWDEPFDFQYLVPGLSFHFKRNIFTIGPVFFLSDIKENKFGRPGIRFSYFVNPFKEHRFLNFHFAYNFGYMREKFKTNSTFILGATTSLVPMTRISYNIANTFGYGIRFNITKGLFLYQNSAMGFIWSKSLYEYGQPVFDSGNFTLIEKTGLFDFGLGYRF